MDILDKPVESSKVRLTNAAIEACALVLGFSVIFLTVGLLLF